MSDSERTLKNLHVLGALSHNDKLLTNDDLFDIYSPTSLRGLLRMWYGERRSQNIQRVRHTVRAGIDCARVLLEDANTIRLTSSEKQRIKFDTIVAQHERMCDGLAKARTGLSNLLLTYREDAALTSQIQLLMSEIEDFGKVIRPHSVRLQGASPVSSTVSTCGSPPPARDSPPEFPSPVRPAPVVPRSNFLP